MFVRLAASLVLEAWPPVAGRRAKPQVAMGLGALAGSAAGKTINGFVVIYI